MYNKLYAHIRAMNFITKLYYRRTDNSEGTRDTDGERERGGIPRMNHAWRTQYIILLNVRTRFRMSCASRAHNIIIIIVRAGVYYYDNMSVTP